MDPERLRQRIDAILDRHDSAFRALREARESIRVTDSGLGEILEAARHLLEGARTSNSALERIDEAYRQAIDAALAANAEVHALLRETDDPTTSA